MISWQKEVETATRLKRNKAYNEGYVGRFDEWFERLHELLIGLSPCEECIFTCGDTSEGVSVFTGIPFSNTRISLRSHKIWQTLVTYMCDGTRRKVCEGTIRTMHRES
jgi:hypothetical protein